MKRERKTTGILFYRRLMRITWTKNVSSEEVLWKLGIKRTLVLRIKEKQLTFLGHMRKERLGKFETHRALKLLGTMLSIENMGLER